jgi:hypothetical protein
MSSAILYLDKEPNGKYKLVINGDDYLINEYEKDILGTATDTATLNKKTIEKDPDRWEFDILNDIKRDDIDALLNEQFMPSPQIAVFRDEQDKKRQEKKQIEIMKKLCKQLHDILIKYNKIVGGSRRRSRRPSRKYKKSAKRVFRKKSRSTRRR